MSILRSNIKVVQKKQNTNDAMLAAYNPKTTGFLALIFAFISAFAFPFLNWASMFVAGMGIYVAISKKMGWKLIGFNLIGLIAGMAAMIVAQK